MIRCIFAAGAALVLAGCVVQAPPGYYGSAYAPNYYQRPYPRQPYPQPAPAAAAPASVAPASVAPVDTGPMEMVEDSPAPVAAAQGSGDAGAAPERYEGLPPASAAPPPSGMTPSEPRNPRAVFADETIDYGVPRTTSIREHDFDSPTPIQVQGARTITTLELEAMTRQTPPPLLIDTIRGPQTVSLPHAVWLKDAGTGRHMDDDIQAWLDMELSNLTGHDKTRPLVFFCASRMCWLAHNAVLRAVDLGYQNVYWYRGGRDAWQAAELPMSPVAAPMP